MVMYRDKEYSKRVQFWIEVVCKNILDAFPQLSTQLLALLVEVCAIFCRTVVSVRVILTCSLLFYLARLLYQF